MQHLNYFIGWRSAIERRGNTCAWCFFCVDFLANVDHWLNDCCTCVDRRVTLQPGHDLWISLFSRVSLCECVKCSAITATVRKTTTSSSGRRRCSRICRQFILCSRASVCSFFGSSQTFEMAKRFQWLYICHFFPVSCLHIVLVVVSCIAASNSSDNHLEGPANDSNFIKIISSSLHRD